MLCDFNSASLESYSPGSGEDTSQSLQVDDFEDGSNSSVSLCTSSPRCSSENEWLFIDSVSNSSYDGNTPQPIELLNQELKYLSVASSNDASSRKSPAIDLFEHQQRLFLYNASKPSAHIRSYILFRTLPVLFLYALVKSKSNDSVTSDMSLSSSSNKLMYIKSAELPLCLLNFLHQRYREEYHKRTETESPTSSQEDDVLTPEGSCDLHSSLEVLSSSSYNISQQNECHQF